MEEIIGFDILLNAKKTLDIYYVIGILSDRRGMSMFSLFPTNRIV